MSDDLVLTGSQGDLLTVELGVVGEVVCLGNYCSLCILHFNVQLLGVVASGSTGTGHGRAVGLNAKLEVTYLLAGQLVRVVGAGYGSQREGEDGDDGKYLFHNLLILNLFINCNNNSTSLCVSIQVSGREVECVRTRHYI